MQTVLAFVSRTTLLLALGPSGDALSVVAFSAKPSAVLETNADHAWKVNDYVQLPKYSTSSIVRRGCEIQAPMEAHIVTAVGPGEAPADWGCDAVWEGGDPVLEKCIAVFGIAYYFEPSAVSPSYLKDVLDGFPLVAGAPRLHLWPHRLPSHLAAYNTPR
jgi:hypothetical protein